MQEEEAYWTRDIKYCTNFLYLTWFYCFYIFYHILKHEFKIGVNFFNREFKIYDVVSSTSMTTYFAWNKLRNIYYAT